MVGRLTEGSPRSGHAEGGTLSTAHESAAELYRAHARFVAGFLLRLGAPQGEMEDLTQEVFLVAHRRGGFVPGKAKATTWLAEIALRVWSNRKRSERRRPAEPAGDAVADLPGHGLGPEAAAGARRALERVQRCLDTLDLDHRSVFVLYELEGEKCGDIATALGVPVGTVYRRLHTARERFRAEYRALTGEGDDGP